MQLGIFEAWRFVDWPLCNASIPATSDREASADASEPTKPEWEEEWDFTLC